MMSWSKWIICMLVTFILTGCTANLSNVRAMHEETELSAWIVYWDLPSGEEELAKIQHKLKNVSYFAAYFDAENKAFIPAGLQEFLQNQQHQERKYDVYLTFVNDKILNSGKVVFKDTEFLQELWQNEVTMKKHIDEIISLTKAGGYNGIEIDYERIWKNKELVPQFLQFIELLNVKAEAENLKVRIILEPSAEFVSDFVKGPEYVIMLYNLYGLHSEPGPKANTQFIKNKIRQMSPLLNYDVAVALATGGCMWGSDGSKKFITEVEAYDLEKKYQAKAWRDEKSYCRVFKYQENNVAYEVWYADSKTINEWIKVSKVNGVNKVSLWRLGSNRSIDKVK